MVVQFPVVVAVQECMQGEADRKVLPVPEVVVVVVVRELQVQEAVPLQLPVEQVLRPVAARVVMAVM